MRIGFAQANLIKAVDWHATAAVTSSSKSEKETLKEKKFDISDRVTGMWRPEQGGKRIVKAPLNISFLYGEDARGPLVWGAIDHCELAYQDLDIIRDPILSELRILKDRIVILPSHCHVTLTYDTDKLQRLVLTAIRQARQRMIETEMGSLHLKIDAKKFVVNRRLHVDGIGTRTILFNDSCQVYEDHLDVTQQVREWIENLGADPTDYLASNQCLKTNGEVDERLQALFFREENSKKMIGMLVRFAAHAVIVSEKKVNGDISADYPGYLKKKLANQFGGIALFAQGLSGDLRPLNREYSHSFAREYGEKLADKLISGFDQVKWEPLKQLELFSEPIHLPLRKDLPTTIHDGDYFMNRIEELYDQAVTPAEKRKYQNEYWFYYRSGDVAKLLRSEWREQGFIECYLYGLRVNDDVVLANPGELFYATGMEMIRSYQQEKIIMVGIANECLSYIPPCEEMEKGGYEPSVCLVKPESVDILKQGAWKILLKMFKDRVVKID